MYLDKVTNRRKIYKLLLICIAFSFFLWNAYIKSLEIPIMHLDGAYQTASSMNRLSIGDLPGRDFFPYLGIGPTFLIFPTYFIMGANVSSSIFSSYLMLSICITLAAALIWKLVTRARLTDCLIISAFSIMAMPFLVNLMPIFIDWISSPGNSLRPIRAFAPYFIVLGYFLVIARDKLRPIGQLLSMGLVIGFAALWSNDFGPTSSLLATAFISYLISTSKNLRKLPTFIALGTFSLMSYVALGQLLTFGNLHKLLAYNFIDVASDQAWYFGPYQSELRVFTPVEVVNVFQDLLRNWMGYLALILIVFVITNTIRKQRENEILLAFLGISALAGGLTASIGGHIGGYFFPFYFWGFFTGTSLLFAYSRSFLKSKTTTTNLNLDWLPTVLVVVLALIVSGRLNEAATKAKIKVQSDQFFYVPELGGYLDNRFSEYVDFARNQENANAIEEYWGIYSAVRGENPIWTVDSVVHALGNQRKLSEEAIDKSVDIIVTTNPTYSREWQPWNFSQNYWFYVKVFDGYVPILTTPTTVVWESSDEPSVNKSPVDCSVSAKGDYITVNSEKNTLIEVTLEYESNANKLSVIRVVNSISFGGGSNGSVSIDPHASVSTFPVYAESSDPLPIGFFAEGTTSVKATDCSALKLLGLPKEAFIANSFFVTDNNWLKGVARDWAGFYLPNTEPFKSNYIKGESICLDDGSRRQILSVAPNDIFLNIFVDGPPIKPNQLIDKFTSICN